MAIISIFDKCFDDLFVQTERFYLTIAMTQGLKFCIAESFKCRQTQERPYKNGKTHTELKCQIWHGKYFWGYNTQI